MDPNYYKEYFDYERNHWWFLARESILYNYIKKHIKWSRELKILNVGCGTGRSSQMLQNFGKVTSIEYDKDCVDYTNSKLNINVQHGNVLDLDFEDNSFDLICAFDVIEHVEDDIQALKEMKRVLKLDGNILITVPAFMSLWSLHDEINHHYRRYTSMVLKDKVKSVRLNVNYSTYFNSILFFPILIYRLLSRSILKPKQKDTTGSDFENLNNRFLNKVLYYLFVSERFIFNLRIKMLFGVSFFIDLRK